MTKTKCDAHEMNWISCLGIEVIAGVLGFLLRSRPDSRSVTKVATDEPPPTVLDFRVPVGHVG